MNVIEEIANRLIFCYKNGCHAFKVISLAVIILSVLLSLSLLILSIIIHKQSSINNFISRNDEITFSCSNLSTLSDFSHQYETPYLRIKGNSCTIADKFIGYFLVDFISWRVNLEIFNMKDQLTRPVKFELLQQSFGSGEEEAVSKKRPSALMSYKGFESSINKGEYILKWKHDYGYLNNIYINQEKYIEISEDGNYLIYCQIYFLSSSKKTDTHTFMGHIYKIQSHVETKIAKFGRASSKLFQDEYSTSTFLVASLTKGSKLYVTASQSEISTRYVASFFGLYKL